MPRNSAERTRILRFLVIGSASAATDLIVYFLLLSGGLLPAIAKGLSYFSGMILGFIGNKFWTFESSQKSYREPIYYVMLYSCTLGVNVLVNLVVSDWIPSPTLFAPLCAIAVTTVLNYLGLRFLTFRSAAEVQDSSLRTERKAA